MTPVLNAKAVLNSLAVVGLLLVTAHALADDTMTHASMTPRQMMKDCVERQKTAGVNMSKAEMKRICKDEMKKQKETGAMPEAPPVDAPHN